MAFRIRLCSYGYDRKKSKRNKKNSNDFLNMRGLLRTVSLRGSERAFVFCLYEASWALHNNITRNRNAAKVYQNMNRPIKNNFVITT